MFFHVKDTQDLVDGTVEMMERLIAAEYRLFALTDNVKEIETYLRGRYDFWRHFDGVINSATCGLPEAQRRNLQPPAGRLSA